MSINVQNLWIKRYFILFLIIFFAACGAGGDYSRPRPVQKGVFLDSAVSGLKYVTETLSGTTDINGTFEYRDGENIKFYIADIFIGETTAKSQITPIDLFSDTSDIASPAVTNMCRFLQALDKNNNPDDGIEISVMVQNALNNQNINIDFQKSIIDFETDILLTHALNQIGYSLPAIKSAQKHLRKTIYGELQSIEVKADLLSTPKGMPIQLHALGKFDKTSEIIDITNQVNWSSSNNSVATIDSTQAGLLNSFSTGNILVNAILDDVRSFIEIEIKSPILTELRIVPQDPLLHPFITQQFHAMGTFSDEITRDITLEVAWASKNVMVATVGSTSGLVRAISEGKTEIIAEYEGKMASSDIMVNDGTLKEIQIYPDDENAVIVKGFNKKFQAIGIYTDETLQDITEQVVWESEHNEIAKVSNVPGLKGVTEAKAVGSTRIIVKMGDVEKSIYINVSQAELDQIRVFPQNKTIPVYSQEQFQARAIFSDLTEEDITDQVLWISDEPKVAAFFDEDIHKGLLSSESPGMTTIRAMYQGLTGATFLTVSDASLESIIVEPLNISVPMGGMHQFKASGIFSDENRYDITDKVDWTVSNVGVARISNDTPNKGLVNTVSIGTAYVRATFKNVTGYADLTVRSADLLSIRITPENISIELGASKQFQATGYYTDNAIVDITHLVQWTSSQPNIMTVNEGLVKTLAIGNSNITAFLKGISRFTTITVY